MLATTEGTHRNMPVPRIGPVLLFVLMFAAATVFHLQIATRMGVWETFWEGGSASYGVLAQSLVVEHTLSLDGTTPSAFRPPLYPLFLALLAQGTQNTSVVVAAQSITAGLTIATLALIATMVTGKYWPALVVPLQFMTLEEIAFENLQQRETNLFCLLLVLSCLIFIAEEHAHRMWKVVVLGGCVGLACLTRPCAAVSLFLMAVWFWRLKRRGIGLSEIARRLFVFAVSLALVLLPWGIWNLAHWGRFTVTATTVGLNLWKGSNPATPDLYPDIDLDVLDELVAGDIPAGVGWWDALAHIQGLDEPKQDAALRQIAQQYIMEDPVRFLRMGFLKLYGLWTPLTVPRGTGNIEWIPSGAKVTNLLLNPSRPFVYLLLYLLTAFGIWRLRDHPLNWFLLTWIVFYTAVHFVTFGETRFRWPLNVLALPISAAGFEWTLTRAISGLRAIGGQQSR